MLKLLSPLLLLLFICIFGCTDKKGSIKLLEEQGYSKIDITGINFLSCGRHDWYRTGFIAYKDDKRISGTVCKGLFFKGKTIRFD